MLAPFGVAAVSAADLGLPRTHRRWNDLRGQRRDQSPRPPRRRPAFQRSRTIPGSSSMHLEARLASPPSTGWDRKSFRPSPSRAPRRSCGTCLTPSAPQVWCRCWFSAWPDGHTRDVSRRGARPPRLSAARHGGLWLRPGVCAGGSDPDVRRTRSPRTNAP